MDVCGKYGKQSPIGNPAAVRCHWISQTSGKGVDKAHRSRKDMKHVDSLGRCLAIRFIRHQAHQTPGSSDTRFITETAGRSWVRLREQWKTPGFEDISVVALSSGRL
jgi:hypothetical protein